MAIPDSDRAYLNRILRMSDTPGDSQTITKPVQAAPHERDHFLEVQHIVDIVLNRYSTEWYGMKMGFFIDLASFVNDHRNLFQINKTFNQNKKTIPLANYPNNAIIRQYLGFQTAERWRTVEASVRELVAAMANRQGTYPDLTRYVGGELKRILGW